MERETEKTIQKLKTIKELDYYLQNSDEFIRRLAILRLRELAPKEAVYTLKDLHDNPAETPGNKYICGWTIKSLLKGRNDFLFMDSYYGSESNGSERYDELFPVISDKAPGAVNFNFGLSTSYSAFNLDKEDVVLERDVYFESGFDFGPWLKVFVASAASNLKNSILSVPAVTGRLLKNFITNLSERKKDKQIKSRTSTEPGKLRTKSAKLQTRQSKMRAKQRKLLAKQGNRHAIPESHTPISDNLRAGQYPPADSYYSLRKALYKKQSFFTHVKKGAFQLFYGLFFPIRFIRRHKLITFTMLFAAYLLLANTDYGRALTTKYFRLDLKTSQTLALQKLEVCSSYLSDSFNRLMGMDEWSKKRSVREADSDQALANSDSDNLPKGPIYTVSAKNGLNIRVSPNPDSDKMGNVPLEFGSTVVFLEKREKDKSGILWYYVKAADGRTGWVSSRYLKEKEG